MLMWQGNIRGMEMKRRSFMKISGFTVFAAAVAGLNISCLFSSDTDRKNPIKKYVGRIRPMGEEISLESRWNG